jgi:transposase
MRTKHKNIDLLKKKAIAMRLKGSSYPDIESVLGVTRSTLSYWLGKLVLPESSLVRIQKRKQLHLVNARVLSNISHRRARLHEIEKHKTEVQNEYVAKKLEKSSLELILTALYLGEGVKRDNVIGLANSNPKIVFAFVNLVRWIYNANENKFRCFLHLRMDQSDAKEKEYWSNALSIPVEKFGKSQFDRRTLGKKTHLGYHGVCMVYYYDVRLAHRLMALQNCLLEKILTGA